MVSGTFTMRDNSWGSLYCRGWMKVVNGVIVELYYAGSPRMRGDNWYHVFSGSSLGDTITKECIEDCLSKYRGKYKVSGKFSEVKE